MKHRHPSRQRLQRWLETDESRRAYRRWESHITACDHCQSTLEEITQLDEGLVADLQTATMPPADLEARTIDGVDDRVRNEVAVGVFLDLFTIGWDVTRSIIDPTNEISSPLATEGDNAYPPDPAADGSDGGD